MIAKSKRIPRSEFRMSGARVAKTPFLSLKTKNNLLSVNRIGVVVGKSVDKRATRRNFLKRQAKAELLHASNVRPNAGPSDGKDILLIMYPKANALSKENLRAEIKKTLKSPFLNS